jgi:hypothetical protein
MRLELDFRYVGHIEQVTGVTVDITSPLPFAGLSSSCKPVLISGLLIPQY